MNIYIGMLQDIGILADDRHECHFVFTTKYHAQCTVCGEQKNLRVEEPKCCGEPMIQNRSGHVSCYVCGNSKLNSEWVWYWPYAKEGRRTNCGYTFTKKRPYKKEQYFMTHLRRYEGMGMSKIANEPWVADIFKEVDVTDRDAYFAVRSWLLKHKKTKYYVYIFTMLYANGGIFHEIPHEVHTKLQGEIKSLCHYYYDSQHCGIMPPGKSMKCVPMMLQKLLTMVGYTPYYNLHRLKDKELGERVDRLFDMYVTNVVNKRHTEPLAYRYRKKK